MVQRLRCLVVVQEIGVRFPVESPIKRDVVQGKDACFGSRRTQVRILSSRHPVRPMAGRFSYKEETSVRFTHRGPFAQRMYRKKSTALLPIGEGSVVSKNATSLKTRRLRRPRAWRATPLPQHYCGELRKQTGFIIPYMPVRLRPPLPTQMNRSRERKRPVSRARAHDVQPVACAPGSCSHLRKEASHGRQSSCFT